jgi:hypothetical protein
MAAHRAGKTVALARRQAQQGTRLDLEGARRQLQRARGVEGSASKGGTSRRSAGRGRMVK